jgi:plasmid stabilization system protein ParE
VQHLEADDAYAAWTNDPAGEPSGPLLSLDQIRQMVQIGTDQLDRGEYVTAENLRSDDSVMTAIELRYSLAAQTDIAEILAFVQRKFSSEYMELAREQILLRCERLCQFPGSSRSRETISHGLRSAILNPNTILYRVLPMHFGIVRILDNRQNNEFASIF